MPCSGMVNRNTHMHHYRLLINGIKFSDSGADVCDRRNEVIATSNQGWVLNKKVREFLDLLNVLMLFHSRGQM
jgi:hypothetical protein